MAPIPIRHLSPTSPADQPFPSMITLPARKAASPTLRGRLWIRFVGWTFQQIVPWMIIRVPLEFTDYLTWARYGQYRGWVSDHYCDTHEDIPLTAEEDEAYLGHECGDDECESDDLPCVVALRVWPDLL